MRVDRDVVDLHKSGIGRGTDLHNWSDGGAGICRQRRQQWERHGGKQRHDESWNGQDSHDPPSVCSGRPASLEPVRQARDRTHISTPSARASRCAGQLALSQDQSVWKGPKVPEHPNPCTTPHRVTRCVAVLSSRCYASLWMLQGVQAVRLFPVPMNKYLSANTGCENAWLSSAMVRRMTPRVASIR